MTQKVDIRHEAAERGVLVSRLHQRLSYSQDAGFLTWKVRPIHEFPGHRHWASWNTRYANMTAGSLDFRHNGYVIVEMDGVTLRAHRIAWAMHTGLWPSEQIDHINGDRADNRIVNLRQVVNSENTKNQRLHAHNTSGYCGVVWHTGIGKWNARIEVDGRRISLGCFSSKSEAIAARESANREYGFSDRHGSPNEKLVITVTTEGER